MRSEFSLNKDSTRDNMPGPTNGEHRKLIGVKTISMGTNYSLYCHSLECATSIIISESELHAIQKRLSDVPSIEQSHQK